MLPLWDERWCQAREVRRSRVVTMLHLQELLIRVLHLHELLMLHLLNARRIHSHHLLLLCADLKSHLHSEFVGVCKAWKSRRSAESHRWCDEAWSHRCSS